MTTHAALPNFGCQQSPIDFATAKIFKTDELGIEVTWTTLTVKANKDGKKRKFDVVKADGLLFVDEAKYLPIDFHWHLPAEHSTGKRHPAEVHVVHVHEEDVAKAQRGQLDWLRIAVIGVYVDKGNTEYKPFALEKPLFTARKDGTVMTAEITKADAFPESAGAYRYEGGLTTPPYSENVTFFILQQPVSALPAQLNDGGEPNSRPVQSVNRRVVIEGDIK